LSLRHLTESKNNYKDFIPVCDYFLFDTPSASYGGSGTKFNWDLINNYNEPIPFLLSGGISEKDVAEILAIKHPSFAGIDIKASLKYLPE
jgi:phosphoribosylanthranilate isomerase